jgi:thiamine transport system ATP-binding protein
VARADLGLDGLALRRGAFTLHADVLVPASGVTAVMGASGSGKSTLLDAVAGFLAPEAGRIRVGEAVITDLPPGARPVSIIFQDNNLFPHLDVITNVALGLRPDARLSDEERDACLRALAQVGLEGFADRLPRDLSGGQRSRAALARALLRERPWLLLDEAVSALGPRLRAEMLELVRETAATRGMAVLMVSHHPEDVARIAERICVVADGRVAAPEDAGGVLADPPEALRDYLG